MDDGQLRELLKDWYFQIDNQFHETVRKLKETNPDAAKEMVKCKYSVFYTNPLKTLKAGSVYFLGLNPGGDSSRDYLDDETLQGFWEEEKKDDWCEYIKVGWGKSGSKTPLQERVQKVLTFVLHELEGKQDITNIFCTNMYFFRSGKDRILYSYGLEDIDCFRYHKAFLEIVQPKVIICNGNGESLSAYSVLRGRAMKENLCVAISYDIKEHIYNTFYLKWFFLSEPFWGSSKTLVVGLPHLSRFSPEACDSKFYGKLKELLDKVR